MAGNDDNTLLLLHCNGTDAATSFSDESSGGATHSMTANGDAQVDTAQKKFGTASALFDGTGDYITTPDHANWTFGSGDFTIDFWLRRGATGAYMGIVNSGTSGGTNKWILVGFSDGDIVRFIMRMDDNSQVTASSSGTITDTNWHHIAAVRDGNTMRLFIDGTADGTADVTGDTLNDSSEVLTIGRTGSYNGEYFTGHLDEIRISNVARWTTNFDVPTEEYAAAAIPKNSQMMAANF